MRTREVLRQVKHRIQSVKLEEITVASDGRPRTGPAAYAAVVDGDKATLRIVADAFGKACGLGRDVHDKPM